MWASARKCVAYVWLVVGVLVVAAGPSLAAQCSDVYPGAQQGSPPDWTWWGFGGACQVQWQASTPQDEQAKSELCRSTSGSYFIHFDSNRSTGRVTCIFSFPDGAPSVAAQPNATKPAIQSAKSDLAPDIPDMVITKTTPDTGLPVRSVQTVALLPPPAEESPQSHPVEASEPRVEDVIIPKPRMSGIAKKAVTEKTTKKGDPTDIEPAATNYDEPDSTDPDPSRLTDTQSCSSLILGNQASCFNAPIRKANGLYVIPRKKGCGGNLVAAVKTTDEKGRCIRKVVVFSPEHTRSEQIRSASVPRVLDAVAYSGKGGYACYSRRHSEVSCDGSVNYSPKVASGKKVASAAPVVSQPKPVTRTKPPVEKTTIFQKMKSLFQ